MAKKQTTQSVRARRDAAQARQKRQRRLLYVGAAVVAVLLFGAFAVIRQVTAPTLEDVTLPDNLDVPPNADGTAWGPVDAPVLIEEFSDFQ
jgi:hypothetical protein